LSSPNFANAPQRLYSAGIGLFFSQLPLTYWKKSVPGVIEVSKLARSMPLVGELLVGDAAAGICRR